MMEAALFRLWAMSLQAGILILIVLTVRFLLSRYPRIYSYGLWVLVGIRLLCPVWVESPFSLQPDLSVYPGGMRSLSIGGDRQPEAQLQTLVPPETVEAGDADWDASKDKQQTPVHDTEQPAEGADKTLLENSASEKDSSADRMSPAGREGLSGGVGRVLEIIYLAGAGGVLLFYLVQYLWMRRRVSAAVREKGNVWLCDRIDSPFVMGVIFPRIYLPYGIKGTEKKYILRHERTHIRHFDPLIRIVGSLCACLHWWNPLVWTAVYFMNQDMEMFCDETVLRHAPMEERKAYARTLLVFARKEEGFETGLAFGESHTQKRIKNIMKKRRQSFLLVSLVAVLAVFCVIALLTVPGGRREEEEPENGQAGENPASQSTDLNTQGSLSGVSNEGAGEASRGTLSDADLSWLMEICARIPDFTAREEMDAAFWENYLFHTYTSDFEREEVNRYSEQYGFEIPYNRVSFEEADGEILQIFGARLGEYGIRPEIFAEDGNHMVTYEDGDLLIAASDSPAFRFTVEDVSTTDILTEVSLLKGSEDSDVTSRVRLYLLPAETERGFAVDGKEESPIGQIPEGQALENQSFDVEMNPYGSVTFAAYAPDETLGPYADVSFKLLQNGEEIYSFPLQATGVRQDQAVFQEMAAVAFPDLNGDGYTDVITIAHYQREGDPIPPQIRIFTYHSGGYFLEETYLEEAYTFAHEEKTVAGIEEFAAQYENQDYFVRRSIYGRWRISGYKLPGVYALTQEEIEGYVDARLEYGITSLWTNMDGDQHTVTGYERRILTADQLQEEYRMNREQLGLSTDDLIAYQVEAEQDSLFGCFFYLVDSDHALIYYEGVFFEAVRE